MLRIKWMLCGLVLIAVIGCNRSKKEDAVQQAPVLPPVTAPSAPLPSSLPVVTQPEVPAPIKPASQPKETVKPLKAKAISKPKSHPAPVVKPSVEEEASTDALATPAVPADQQQLQEPEVQKEKLPEYAVIPSGSYLKVRLQSPLDTAVNISGDSFRAILDQDIQVNGKIVAARGTVCEGKVSHAERSGRVQGKAGISLQLVNMMIEGAVYPLQTEILNFTAESSTKKDAGKVGIAAGIGAVIGAIAGGGKGAAIGAAVGGGAGGATVLATRGNEVKLEAERALNFELQRDIRVKLP
jgi:hypothetical protein